MVFLQEKFVLPPSCHSFVLKSLNRKWKEYKSTLKTRYMLPGLTEERVAEKCPPDVAPHQWVELVHYWFSERGQVSLNFFEAHSLKYYDYVTRYNFFFILQTYADIGRAARASQSVPHTSGSRSYARVRQDYVSFLNCA